MADSFAPAGRTGAAVVCISLALGLAAFAHLGVLHGADTVRYLSGAGHLIAGEPFQGKEGSYPGYIAVVAAMRLLGAGEMGVVLLQIAVAALAALALYEMGRMLGGPVAGGCAAALFAANPEIVKRQCYLLTDSLYISLVVLATWAAHRASMRGGAWYPAALLVVLAAALVRPNGWVMIPVALVFWIVRAPWRRRARWAAAAALVAACAATVLSLPALRRGVESQGPVQSLRKGEVVWGYDGWRVPMPADAAPRDDLAAGIAYVARHPLATTRLAASRVAAELAHVRPFYSWRHNAAVIVFLAVVYPLALIGFVHHRREPLTTLAALIIAAHLAIIAATFADWDGRFLLYILPLFLLMAGCGLARLISHRDTEARR